jgi:hypothetical protein
MANARNTVFAQFTKVRRLKMKEDSQKKFIPQLAIDAEFFRRICQSLYDVKPKAQSEWCVAYCQLLRWRCNFKRLSQDGGRADFSKQISAPLSLMMTY